MTTANTRPTLTPDDRAVLKFALASMRDDRARTSDFQTDRRYDEAEALFRRLLGEDYRAP